MKKPVVGVLCVLLLLLVAPVSMFAQSATPTHCVIVYKLNASYSGIDGSGVATIDLGEAKKQEVKYDSLAKCLNDYTSQGWTLVQFAPVGNYVLVLMRK